MPWRNSCNLSLNRQKDIFTSADIKKEVIEGARHFVDDVRFVPTEQDTLETKKPTPHEIIINLKTMPTMFVKGLGAGIFLIPNYSLS